MGKYGKAIRLQMRSVELTDKHVLQEKQYQLTLTSTSSYDIEFELTEVEIYHVPDVNYESTHIKQKMIGVINYRIDLKTMAFESYSSEEGLKTLRKFTTQSDIYRIPMQLEMYVLGEMKDWVRKVYKLEEGCTLYPVYQHETADYLFKKRFQEAEERVLKEMGYNI